ncbi:MAG: hypothetical protein FJX46_10920 [Alphaproteobacteria bacterium]|nr:hypothetical protein [Alphaproteobacteria bacterium]
MNAPRLKTPSGAADCHMHIYDRRFPYLPEAALKPPEAHTGMYRAVCRRLGIDRVVVVQPSSYGTDNRCTLTAISELGAGARGVAVVDDRVDAIELKRLTQGGMRGARFHMMRGGVLPWSMLEPVAARIAEHGWHVQLQMDGRELHEREAQLKALPTNLVIDHVGKFLEPVTLDHPGFKALARLIETGRYWVKLSAAYEVSKAGPPLYGDVGALAKALVKLAPERMLWASNWPHPSVPATAAPDDAVLLDLLLDWAPDEAVRRKILVDNPAEVYGF